MKKRFSTLFFNFIFVNLIVSQPILGQSDVIVPLNVGNYWVFTDSTFLNDSLIVVDTSRVEITGKTIIEFQGNNYEVFFWNWFNMNSNPPQPEPLKWLVRNEPDGLWEYGMLNDMDTLLLKNLNLKFPANIGDSWPIMAYLIADTSITVSDTLIMECLDTDKEYITPCGTYQCYVYQYQWNFMDELFESFVCPFNFIEHYFKIQSSLADTFKVRLFFSPNVGMVGYETELGPISTRRVLNSYDLITDVHINENNLSGFQLFQNYPNPFNPSTFIKYSIPNSSNISIKVFDILGNEIITLFDEYKQAGSYEIEFNAANLPSGLYFYRIINGKYSETKKMILLK